MKRFLSFLLGRLGTGVLIVAPVYLCTLLLLKALHSVRGLVQPLTKMLPDAVEADYLVSLILVVLLCLLVGLLVRTRRGRRLWELMERSLFQRMPGYAIVRGLTQQLAGETQEESWKPALVEVDRALLPAFIIERLDSGYAVFVPSVPTPLAGTLYIMTPERVHPLDVPFTHALQIISRWGAGSRELVEAMKRAQPKQVTGEG